jgi:hypothetical protein
MDTNRVLVYFAGSNISHGPMEVRMCLPQFSHPPFILKLFICGARTRYCGLVKPWPEPDGYAMICAWGRCSNRRLGEGRYWPWLTDWVTNIPTKQLTYSTTSQVSSQMKFLSHTSGGGDELVWSNCGMMINKGNLPKRLWVKPAPISLRPLQICQVTWGWTRNSKGEASA